MTEFEQMKLDMTKNLTTLLMDDDPSLTMIGSKFQHISEVTKRSNSFLLSKSKICLRLS